MSRIAAIALVCLVAGCGPSVSSSLESLTATYNKLNASCWANGLAMGRYIELRRRNGDNIEADMNKSIEASMKLCSVTDTAPVRKIIQEANNESR